MKVLKCVSTLFTACAFLFAGLSAAPVEAKAKHQHAAIHQKHEKKLKNQRPLTVGPIYNITNCPHGPVEFPVYADQVLTTGTVTISNTTTEIIVEVDMTGTDFRVEKMHIFAAPYNSTCDVVPVSGGGNPNFGQFPFQFPTTGNYAPPLLKFTVAIPVADIDCFDDTECTDHKLIHMVIHLGLTDEEENEVTGFASGSDVKCWTGERWGYCLVYDFCCAGSENPTNPCTCADCLTLEGCDLCDELDCCENCPIDCAVDCPCAEHCPVDCPVDCPLDCANDCPCAEHCPPDVQCDLCTIAECPTLCEDLDCCVPPVEPTCAECLTNYQNCVGGIVPACPSLCEEICAPCQDPCPAVCPIIPTCPACNCDCPNPCPAKCPNHSGSSSSSSSRTRKPPVAMPSVKPAKAMTKQELRKEIKKLQAMLQHKKSKKK